MSAQPEIKKLVRNAFLDMESVKVGDEVGFVLNARNVLPATVIGFGTPLANGRRLHLKITEELPEVNQTVNENTGEVQNVTTWVPSQRDLLNVRYLDPSLIIDPESRQPMQIEGKYMHAPPAIDRFTPGTWFFIDHYSVSLFFWRPAVQKRDRVHGIMLPQYEQKEAKENHGPFTDYRKAAKVWEDGKRKAHVGWWQKIDMTFEFKSGAPEVA